MLCITCRPASLGSRSAGALRELNSRVSVSATTAELVCAVRQLASTNGVCGLSRLFFAMASFISLVKYGDWKACPDKDCKFAQHEHWHAPEVTPRKLLFPDGATMAPSEARPAWGHPVSLRSRRGQNKEENRRRKVAARMDPYEQRVQALHDKAFKKVFN